MQQFKLVFAKEDFDIFLDYYKQDYTIKIISGMCQKWYQDEYNLFQVNICNQSYKKKIRLSMETYPGMDVVICEIGQDIQVVDQA